MLPLKIIKGFVVTNFYWKVPWGKQKIFGWVTGSVEGRGGKRVQKKRNGLTAKTINSSMKISGSDVSSRHIASKAMES